MDSQSVTGWIDQLSAGDGQAAEQLWRHISARLEEFARQRLDVQTRRRYDEHDAANSAFHSLCRGLADGRMEAESRDAFWGLLAVITSRKITAQRRYSNRQKRGVGAVLGESGFGDAGINEVAATGKVSMYISPAGDVASTRNEPSSCNVILEPLAAE